MKHIIIPISAMATTGQVTDTQGHRLVKGWMGYFRWWLQWEHLFGSEKNYVI